MTIRPLVREALDVEPTGGYSSAQTRKSVLRMMQSFHLPVRRDLLHLGRSVSARSVPLTRYVPAAVVVAGLAFLLVEAGSATVVQDTWSTLVAGRTIVRSGLPTVDHLTLLGAGRRWTDQQWLAQLVFYGFDRLGGLEAVVLLGAAAGLAAFGIVLAGGARRSPSSPTIVALVGFLAVAAGEWAFQVRAQELVLPLGAATYTLLLADPAAERRRTLAVIPILCLWANLHGSVVLGAAVVCLYGLTVAVGAALRRRSPASAIPYVVLPPIAVLASPYWYHLVGYYHLLLVDPPFRGLDQEWDPTRPAWFTAPFFALGGVALLTVVLRFRKLTLFELALLALTFALGLDALHNTIWFSLAALAVVPGRLLRLEPRPSRFGGAVFLILSSFVVLMCVVALTSRPSRYDPYDGAAVAAIEQVVHETKGPVFADDAHADWILWEVPSSEGRVLYDSRTELFTRADLIRVDDVKTTRAAWRQTLAHVQVVVSTPTIAERLERAGWGRAVYAVADTVVLRRRFR